MKIMIIVFIHHMYMYTQFNRTTTACYHILFKVLILRTRNGYTQTMHDCNKNIVKCSSKVSAAP